MKLLYLDCFAGISGDMFLGALLDLGVSEERLRAELQKLPLSGYQISSRRVVKQNISATKFDVMEDQAPALHKSGEHRGYSDIVAMIDRSALSSTVKERAGRIFRRLGEAEAKIHGIPLEEVHFHEIGAVDSIVDIVGACIAVEALGVDEVQASPPKLGSGIVEIAHGRFPVPAPATLELLRGIPVESSSDRVELVTPTGAALLVEFCTTFGPMPAMSIEKIGYGAGSRDLENAPNVVRAVLGKSAADPDMGIGAGSRRFPDAETDTVAVIETNIDDMNPQLCGEVMERLLAAGALDVYLTPVQMKKNRPGTLLTVLGERKGVDALTELILTHTTSFGVRVHEAQRRKLAREIVTVETRFGEIEVKIGRLAGRIVARSPEFESCKQAAARFKISVKDVYNEAAHAAGDIR
jgi:hypothetical protein